MSEYLAGQPVDAVGKKEDLIVSIIGNAFSFRNESPQHPVVTFHRAFSNDEYG